MERALERVSKELSNQLEEYRKHGAYNVLVPTLTIQEISPYHKPVLEIVRINPDPRAGEVYEIVQGSGEYSLRAVALQRIGYAAGLIWNARSCGRTDDGTNPNIVSYRAEAAARKEDGTYMLLNAEYMVDLGILEEETRESYEKKSKELAKEKKWSDQNRKEYVEKMVRRDMLQKRKFRLQLAQTGAMDRVIRKILGLKGTYRREELEKPFVVPKIVFHPDISDPDVRKMLLQQGLEASNILFGPQMTQGIIERSALPEPNHNVIELPANEGEIVEGAKEEEDKPEELPFDMYDRKGKMEYLKKLMKRKGYQESKLKKSLDQFTDEHLSMFKDHLDSLPDLNDLPFQ